jgi:molybdenum cofactor cytidylyltransferase
VALVATVVLAAGFGRRFGSQKLAAALEGRSVLQHVLDRLADAGVADPIVVVPPDATELDRAVEWRGARRVPNPDPGRGLSSSLRVGWATALTTSPGPDAVLLVLGDQPRVSAGVIRRLIHAPLDPRRPLLAPRYATGGGGNPLRVEVSAASLVESAEGDRGLGPVIAGHPELVRFVEVQGGNPDVDTPADLAGLARSSSPPGKPGP